MATIIGVVTLVVTASGVFGEMQTALNVIWKAKPKGTTASRLIRARAASLGLVASLGFLLMVSLVVTPRYSVRNYLYPLIPSEEHPDNSEVTFLLISSSPPSYLHISHSIASHRIFTQSLISYISRQCIGFAPRAIFCAVITRADFCCADYQKLRQPTQRNS